MSELPKFVRDRLRVTGAAGSHPDPDVLTAFSERLLPAPERSVVIEHLARCGDCRDVVAMALPASDTTAVPVLIEHRQWFRGPVLRWGVALAGVLVIAAVGIRQYGERHQPQTVAMFADRSRLAQNEAAKDRSPQSDAALNDKAKDETGASQPAAPKSQSRDDASTPDRTPATLVAEPSPRERVALSQPPSLGSGKVAAGMGGGVTAGTYSYRAGQGTKLAMNTPPQQLFPRDELKSGSPPAKQLGSNSAPKPTAPSVPSMSQTVEVQAEAGQVVAQEAVRAPRADRQSDMDKEQRQRANAEPAGAGADRAMSKAKPAADQAGYGSAPAALAPPADSVKTSRALRGPTLTWTISSEGALQRSFDGGKIWQAVDVSSSAIPNMRLETVTAAQEMKSDTRNNKKLAKQAGAAPVFRAVAATGSDVWAGGSSGALYHSTDAGDHWIRIFPFADSVLLTADITSIQSSDPQHITIDTAASEVWATSDAGRSWQKH